MKLFQMCLFSCTLFLAITENCMAQSTMAPWLTSSADNSRSGWNQHETQLTQASIVSKGISRETIIPVIGDARGMEAQPLILPNVKTMRGTHDVRCFRRWLMWCVESTHMMVPASGWWHWEPR